MEISVFRRLPPELRNVIYEMVCNYNGPCNFRILDYKKIGAETASKHLALAHTDREFYQEVMPIILSAAKINFELSYENYQSANALVQDLARLHKLIGHDFTMLQKHGKEISIRPPKGFVNVMELHYFFDRVYSNKKALTACRDHLERIKRTTKADIMWDMWTWYMGQDNAITSRFLVQRKIEFRVDLRLGKRWMKGMVPPQHLKERYDNMFAAANRVMAEIYRVRRGSKKAGVSKKRH